MQRLRDSAQRATDNAQQHDEERYSCTSLRRANVQRITCNGQSATEYVQRTTCNGQRAARVCTAVVPSRCGRSSRGWAGARARSVGTFPAAARRRVVMALEWNARKQIATARSRWNGVRTSPCRSAAWGGRAWRGVACRDMEERREGAMLRVAWLFVWCMSHAARCTWCRGVQCGGREA